jgi:hypothetical protein
MDSFEQVKNYNIPEMISAVIGIFIIVAFIAAFFNLLLGGLQWIVSGGKEENVDKAKKRIINAFIGLVIVVAAWPAFQYIQTILGVSVIGSPLELPTFFTPQQ